MNRIIIPLLVLISLLIFSCRNNRTVTIELQIPPGEYDSIGFHLSEDNITAYSLWGFEHFQFDSAGKINFKVEVDDIRWFFITIHGDDSNDWIKSRFFALIQPGDNYLIKYDENNPNLFELSGDNSCFQNQFNDLEINHTHAPNIQESDPQKMVMDLKDSISHYLKPFTEMYNHRQIPVELYNSATSYIEYLLAYNFINTLKRRNSLFENPKNMEYYQDYIPLDMSQKEYIEVLKEVYEKYPINVERAALSPNYGDYLDLFLWYKSLNDTSFLFVDNTKSRKLQKVNKMENYIDDNLLEYYFGSQFTGYSMKSGPETTKSLFMEFQNRFPESKYLPGIARLIKRQTNHYMAFYPNLYDTKTDEKIGKKENIIFSPEVKFVENPESQTSFDSILNQFRGKNVFIDFWASWCSPCRGEFKYSDSLYRFLQDHDIEMLYISTDKDESKWLNSINTFNLRGYHLRINNEKLESELKNKIYFIPTYMIIDSTGNIVVSDAEKPHTKTILYNQILESLKFELR